MMWEVMKINMDIDGLNGKPGGGVFTGLGIKSGVCDCNRWGVHARKGGRNYSNQFHIRLTYN